jgi:hypothetical protein
MSLSNKPGCDSDRLSCSASLRIRPLATPDRLAACALSSVARPPPPSPRIPEGRQAGRQSERAQLRPDKVRPASQHVSVKTAASRPPSRLLHVGRCALCLVLPCPPPLCMRLLPRDRDIMAPSVHRNAEHLTQGSVAPKTVSQRPTPAPVVRPRGFVRLIGLCFPLDPPSQPAPQQGFRFQTFLRLPPTLSSKFCTQPGLRRSLSPSARRWNSHKALWC